MKYLNRLFILSIVFSALSLSCNAGSKEEKNAGLVNSLVKKLVLPNTSLDDLKVSIIVQGDFNGDGFDDFAALFLPDSAIRGSNRLNVKELWNYSESLVSNKIHKSLVIFHGSKNGWLSDSTQGFVLLDKSGVLDTPSFELLVSRVGDKEYKNNASYLSVVLKSDLLILSTEAGIDTVIYWDKGIYNLFESDEIP